MFTFGIGDLATDYPEVPLCVLFADGVVFIYEMRMVLNAKYLPNMDERTRKKLKLSFKASSSTKPKSILVVKMLNPCNIFFFA